MNILKKREVEYIFRKNNFPVIYIFIVLNTETLYYIKLNL